MSTPESLARQQIDSLLTACGWTMQDRNQLNLAVGAALLRAGRLRQSVLRSAFEGRLL